MSESRTFARAFGGDGLLTLASMVCGLTFFVGSGGQGLAQSPDRESVLKPTIFVNIDAATWKTRGRFLYDLAGTILKKVGLAGFQVVRQVTQPHEYELLVVYREERGEQYRIDAWGTTIRGEFRFSGMSLSHPATWTIVEYSQNTVSASPPYLDALVKFETHPYYFFLGGILRYLVEQNGNLEDAFLAALEQRIFSVYPEQLGPRDRATAQDHFMDPPSVVYQDLAFQRAFEELQRQGYSERKMVPMARKVLLSPTRALRLTAVQWLVRAEDFASCSRLKGVVEQDADPEVRGRVQAFLSQCPPS